MSSKNSQIKPLSGFPMALPHGTELWSALTQFYDHLTHHIIAGPQSISWFVPFLLLPTALLIPPSILSHRQLCVLFLPAIYAYQVHAWLQIGGIEVLSMTLTLWAFVLLALRDPRRTYRRLRVQVPRAADEPSGKRQEEFVEERYPEDLGKRVQWVLTLLVSIRLTGWKNGDPSHDKTQPPKILSRSAFLRHALGILAKSYLIMDATSCYVHTDPYFHASNMSVDAPFPPPTPGMPTLLIILRLLPPRVLRSAILAGQVYAMVTSMFYLPTPPAVGLNAIGILPDEWSPHTWPVFFGKFSAVGERGLRGLWGSWWHHMNRQITTTPSRALIQVLGISTSSTLGYAILTVSTFFLSGVIHMGMIPPQPETKLMSANAMRLYVGAFFWAQIPAFGAEMVVSRMVAKLLPRIAHWEATKVLVLVWVAGWLCLTLPLLTVPFREIRYWHYCSVPISLLRGLVGKGWTTW